MRHMTQQERHKMGRRHKDGRQANKGIKLMKKANISPLNMARKTLQMC